MTKRQTAVLSAYQKMLLECDKAPETVAKITLFKAKIARVREIVAEIQTLSPQFSESTKGNTSTKNELLEELVDQTDLIASAVHSYAHDKGDTNLMEKVNYKRSKLTNLGQNQILEIAKVVLNNAKPVPAADMAEAGISAEELTEFADLIAQVDAMVPENAVTEVEKSAIGERIRELFAELADIKANHLNRLSKQFIRKDPDFHYRYKTTMIVQYSSGRKKDSTDTTTNITK